jgi:RHS repeat-associated protein
MRIRTGLTVLSLVLFTFSAPSQTTSSSPADIGLQAYHDYHGGDIDHIDLDNGGLNLTIPLVSYPQRGGALTEDFVIVMNSQSRTYQRFCLPPPDQSECEFLWMPRIPGLYMSPQNDADSSPAIVDSQQISATVKGIPLTGSDPTQFANQITWHTADGGSHPSGQTTSGQIALDGSNFQSGYIYTPAENDQGYTESCVWGCSPPSIISSPTVLGKKGDVTYLTSASASNAARIDTDGNYITDNGSVIIDTVGRSIPYPALVESPTSAQIQSCSGSLSITEIYSWTPPGYSTPFLFCYINISLQFYSSDTSGAEVTDSPTEMVLQSIVLPNLQTWTFAYSESIADCGYSSGGSTNIGDVTQIKFPTGGTINYSYTCISPWNSTVSDLQTVAVASRTVNANDPSSADKWTYSYSGKSTTITDPLDNQTVQSLAVGSVSNSTNYSRTTKYYTGNATSGKLLRTVQRVYPPQYATWAQFPLYPSSETTTLNNGDSSETTHSYCCDISYDYSSSLIAAGTGPYTASYGKITDSKVYDYSASGPGTLLRDTQTKYLFQSNSNYTNPGFFDLVSSQTIYNGSGTQMAQTSYGYDQTARVTSGIASLSGSEMTTPPYSVYGHQTTKTTWLNTASSNPTTTISYYDTGETYQTKDPLGNTTSTYFCTGSAPTTVRCTASTYRGALPTVVSNALNQQTSFSYRTDTGQKLTVKDPNGQTTSYCYDSGCTGASDPLNRLMTVNYPDGGQANIQYHDTAPIGATVTQKINSSTSKQTQAIVDGLGRMSETILLSAPGGATYTLNTYDALGRSYQTYNPTRCQPITTNCGESTWGYTTESYDALSRKTSLIDSDNVSTQSWTYSGNVVASTDENSNQWARTSDALGRLTIVQEPNGSAQAPSMTTNYTYDSLSNLLSVAQLGGASASGITRNRSFTYDSLSRLLTATNPESGTISYTYDADSNLTSKTDARSVMASYSYDALNRLTKKSYSDGVTPTSLFVYDTGNITFSTTQKYTTSNVVGRLSVICVDIPGACQSMTAYSYDPMGRTVETLSSMPSNPTTGAVYAVSATYDLAGDRTSLTNSTGRTFNYSYDAAARLQTASNTVTLNGTAVTTPMVSSMTYFPSGQPQTMTTNTGSAAITGTWGMDNRLRVTSYQNLSTTNSGNTNYGYSLKYTLNSNVSTSSETVYDSGVGAESWSWAYSYDSLNRLSSAISSGAIQFGCAETYDPFGNRTNQTVTGGSGYSCTSGPAPVTSGTNLLSGYSYDNAGNLLFDGFNTLTYDGEGRLATSTSSNGGSTSYLYDAEGERVSKTAGGVETDYIRDLDGTLLDTYVSGSNSGQPQEMWIGGRHYGTMYAFSNKTQGSMLSLTNWLGSEAARSYTASNGENSGVPSVAFLSQPFGDAQTTLFGGDFEDIHFTGKERDTESGNDYFGARYYASSMGRFMSPDDDSDQNAPDPQSWNLYSYVRNNPLTNTDSDGHDVNVCDNQGNCRQISNAQYQAAQQAGNGSLNVPTLDQVGMNGNGSGQFNSTAITDSSGQTVGSATYVSDGPTDYYANRNGINQIGQASATVGPIAGVVMGAVGIAMPAMFAADAAPLATGIAAAAKKAVDLANLSNKIERQMVTRGWTKQDIQETIDQGVPHDAVNKGTGGPATEYVNPSNGRFVVVDNSTKQVIQVSGPGHLPNYMMK